MKVDPAGDASLTRWRVLGAGPTASPGWSSRRRPAAPTSSASIAPMPAGRSPATRSMAAISPARPPPHAPACPPHRPAAGPRPADRRQRRAAGAHACPCSRPAAGREPPMRAPDGPSRARRPLQRGRAHMNYGSGAATNRQARWSRRLEPHPHGPAARRPHRPLRRGGPCCWVGKPAC